MNMQYVCFSTCSTTVWKSHGMKTSHQSVCSPKLLPPFESPVGPTRRTKREKTPLQVFLLFFTLVLLETIVTQTNMMAAKKGVTLGLCIEELQAFIGMNIAMGMLRLPQIRDYWATDEVLSTPWFPSIMPRDRFFQIMRFLHLVDSSQQRKKGEEGYDPLFKVRSLIDHLSAVFPRYYQPGRQLAVDEMMIGTRCRISFLQYLPKKPVKFGIKVFVNSESKTGYVLTFQIYTGKVTSAAPKSVGHRVVLDLLGPYLGKGHWLFTDNYYTSPELLLDLLAKGTYATGTVRQNRVNFPEVLKSENNKNLDTGTYHFATSGSLTAVLWHDRKDVTMLSTAHNQSIDIVMKRPKGSRDKVQMPCPTCICDYNAYMGGVDLTDQHISYYSLTQRRTIKWWKKVFWRMVDISILNSWIIFRSNFPDKITSHRLFRIQLVHELVQPLLSLKASPDCPATLSYKGRRPTNTEKRLLGKHFPYKSSRRGQCVVCCNKVTSQGKKDTKTMNFCPKCEVHLCNGSCFEAYHTMSKY